ncbi:hypothetical protein K144316041_p21530 (plasmid) [Clostridium tetani]|uniref:hypothetical protein n=1 Tax=Clostridium tetani TaxID=1513 RepID=UPI0029542695|nr:hypothetical protein [Clostridium tetani]BDR74314.1 hypothetical protein K144316041_p21530 [Clostridium tetani]
MENIKIHNNINIKDNKQLINKDNKKNWKKVKIFNKIYRLNPIVERRYRTIGDVIVLATGIISIMFLYVVLAI